jgi:hypothetical protein
MFRRRRPLLRAAAVGGGAYLAGKHVARNSAEREQQEYEQNQRIDDLEQQQAPAAPAAPAAPDPGATSAMTDQLSKLAALHTQGVLTDDEFAAAKAKLLGI